MPVELTPEEQAKFDEVLKERGYDEHAKEVIAKRGQEAKANRERAEKLEAENKTFREAETARATAEEKRKAEAADEAKKAEDAKKSFEQRLTEIEESFARKLTTVEKAQVKKQEELLADLKARDAQILTQAVRAEASKRGIIDEELVSLLDLSSVPIEKGSPDREKIAELIDAHAKAKPHLYKDAGEEERGHSVVVRPVAKEKPGAIDWSRLTPAEFDAAEERLRAQRV